MLASDFENRLAKLAGITFLEDFQSALCGLYAECTSVQRNALRRWAREEFSKPARPWKNHTDYDRSDLTREQRMRQRLLALSISDGTDDYRDDLLTIAFCYHNLALMGFDADKELAAAAKLSAPKFGNLVDGFIRRADKSPGAFRLAVVQTDEGPAAERVL